MSKFLFAILILYLLPLVISTIGFYLFDFKGHTVGDFCKYLITEEDDMKPLPFIVCPVVNILFGIIAIIIICTNLIILPIKILNKKYKLWSKIQKIRIK
nr:MAG: hypothetical protein [Bacteriophage sp.]